MREILFRGKRVDNGEWLKGYLHKIDGIGKGYRAFAIQVQDIDSRMCRPHSHEVIPETVGQFTGLTDKNGKKIFEGDIVRLEDFWDEGKVFIVKYTDDKVGSCGCCFPEFGGIGFVMEAKDGERVCYDKDVIVIGNVTDNPELLESE